MIEEKDGEIRALIDKSEKAGCQYIIDCLEQMIRNRRGLLIIGKDEIAWLKKEAGIK